MRNVWCHLGVNNFMGIEPPSDSGLGGPPLHHGSAVEKTRRLVCLLIPVGVVVLLTKLKESQKSD